jgi:hypothetical protein
VFSQFFYRFAGQRSCCPGYSRYGRGVSIALRLACKLRVLARDGG